MTTIERNLVLAGIALVVLGLLLWLAY